MATINITNLSNKKNGRSYNFSDLHLDFETKKVSQNSKNSDIVSGNDILADYDESAIINSITNILLQRRYLNNQFQVDLKRHIGKPISDMAAMSLGNDIKRGIELFEPRVKIQNITITPNINKNLYYIQLSVVMGNFSENAIVLQGILENNGNLQFIK